MAMLDDEEALIVCNGYKDEEYIETALMASKLGRTVLIVVEKFSELALIAETAKKLGVRPRIGIRVKLAAKGSGRWEASGGDRSKFGLSTREVVEAINFLRANDLLSCFELLHFHLGSQISAIRAVKNALREAGRFYVEVAKMGAPLKYFDAGGGLGVDYDGSQTNFASSMNYTMQEYANDIVFSLQEICDAAGVAHPTIVTESGRAIVAHHSMLVIDILGVGEFDVGKAPEQVGPRRRAAWCKNLFETYREISRKNVLEAYHDALEYKEEALQLFNLGNLSLSERVVAEDIFWAICQKMLKLVRELREVPEELEGLERALSRHLLLQLLDVPVAARHLGHRPAVPDHADPPPGRGADAAGGAGRHHLRLRRQDRPLHRSPRRQAVLELHPVNGQDYYLGVFLIGAYQEILGDLHNLFGNTNTVHVSLAAGGGYQIEHVVTGDTVTDVLKYVSYAREDLVARVRRFAELAVRANRMSLEETRSMLRMYEEGLAGYTYLERS